MLNLTVRGGTTVSKERAQTSGDDDSQDAQPTVINHVTVGRIVARDMVVSYRAGSASDRTRALQEMFARD